jgi:thioredoxin-related protein
MRTVLLVPLLWLAVWSTGHAADGPGLPWVKDLAAETRDPRPLVLMFSASDCGYCRQLEADELLPTVRSGDYAVRVRMRKISLDSGESVMDFDGRSTPTDEIASRYRVWVTPTVILLGPDGTELSERLVGVGTPDFYGAYLDRSIRQAERRLTQLADSRNTL